MRTLDNVLVSIPNQELLRSETENFGRQTTIRRHVKITPGYEHDVKKVEQTMLDAAIKVERVLKSPEPYVRITNFLDYAVEYTLYAFIDDVSRIREIDAEIYRSVLETCKKQNIDISTPMLLKQIP
jgi:small-conductance mechanosensitive channel